ncbi:MAG: dTMP kinase [Simkaniaceae bacterium]|nr:dTMP kinase [Simkaniaceae bacterium]
MKHKPLFITLEGGEGAGKTTLIEGLASHFEKQGRKVLITREPGATPLGLKIRHLLLHEKEAPAKRAELFLFLADRAEHVEKVITPALERGEVVISDRFFDSTIAYQGAARNFSLEKIQEMSLFATNDLIPTRTFFLDIDPEIGLKRAGNVGEQDRLESENIKFHEAVRKGFQDLANQEDRICTLDATLPPEKVLAEAIKCL